MSWVVGLEIWDLYASKERWKEKWVRDRCEEVLCWGTEGECWWTYLAGKRNEMMFTEAVDGDFPDQDHLVMIFGEDGVVDNV